MAKPAVGPKTKGTVVAPWIMDPATVTATWRSNALSIAATSLRCTDKVGAVDRADDRA